MEKEKDRLFLRPRKVLTPLLINFLFLKGLRYYYLGISKQYINKKIALGYKSERGQKILSVEGCDNFWNFR